MLKNAVWMYFTNVKTDGMYLMRAISIEGTVTKHALLNFVQTSLTSIEESRMTLPEDHVAVQRILPYPTVEGDEFKRLNIGDPLSTRHCRVKSEEYYRTTLMPATYDKVVKHVMNLLQEAAGISFTTDGRSNPKKIMLIADARKLAGVTDISCTSHTLQLVLHGALFTLCKHECKLSSKKPQACRHLVEHQLTMILQTTAADQGLNQMKVALRHAMCCRFSYINSSAPYVAATLIDLCYNDSYIKFRDIQCRRGIDMWAVTASLLISIHQKLSTVEVEVRPMPCRCMNNSGIVTSSSRVCLEWPRLYIYIYIYMRIDIVVNTHFEEQLHASTCLYHPPAWEVTSCLLQQDSCAMTAYRL
ncbi:hypothetical protein ACJMK2_001183 [Sinanodonta woodiana]|uniref:Uncharacterized protein n=1 Tax=Sinanodonta woodiana TaxID=1069815 RepID=A0ABD3XUX0_SINWO